MVSFAQILFFVSILAFAATLALACTTQTESILSTDMLLLCLLSPLAWPPPGYRSLAIPGGADQAVILARVLMPALHLRTEALPVALLDEVVHQFARAVVHFDIERLHLTGEVVERHNRRNRDEKTEGCRHQCL